MPPSTAVNRVPPETSSMFAPLKNAALMTCHIWTQGRTCSENMTLFFSVALLQVSSVDWNEVLKFSLSCILPADYILVFSSLPVMPSLALPQPYKEARGS